MKHPLLFSTLLLFTLQCPACEALNFGLHLGTYHIDVNQADYNDVNLGAYVMCDGWTAGTLRNSDLRQSTYAGYTAQASIFGLTVGTISGYGKPHPLAVASVKLGYLRVGVFPRYRGSPAGIHFMLEF